MRILFVMAWAVVALGQTIEVKGLGFERTRDISTKSAAEIAETAKAWGQNDDITVVIVRRAG